MNLTLYLKKESSDRGEKIDVSHGPAMEKKKEPNRTSPNPLKGGPQEEKKKT